MKVIQRSFATIVTSLAISVIWAGSVYSEVIIIASEDGNDVVFQGSGTLNLAGLTFADSGGGNALILPATPGEFAVFSTGGGWDNYAGFKDPGPIGPGNSFVFGSSTGDALFISSAIGVPQGYNSEPIEFTTTFSDESFASIGLAEGTYEWSWGDGTAQDQITLHIGKVPILLGDVNLDGVVNLLDVEPFIQRLVLGVFQVEADINQDGVVDLLDVEPFVEIING